MRKLLLLVLAILLIAGVAQARLSDVTVQSTLGVKPGQNTSPGIGDIMGQGPYKSSPQRTFRLVRYVPSASTYFDRIISKDTIVIWDSTASGDDGVTVTRTTVSVDSRVAGILAVDTLPPVSTDVISTAVLDESKRNWTWLQTYGAAECIWGDSTAAVAGDAFGTSARLGTAATFPAGTGFGFEAISQEPASQGYAGFIYDAATDAGVDVQCFLKCE